jgi:transcriptional regulator with XRE-family HTH domain
MYKRIRDLRKNRHLTQKQIGQILNMSQTGYNQYEIGKNDIPTKVLIELAKFYNTSIDYILELTDEQKPYPRKK